MIKYQKRRRKMQYKNILFDLDGTLTDSGPGIRNAVRHALRRFGIEETEKEKLDRFIGPPLYDSFQRFYGIDPETAKNGEEYFREYYRDIGIFENSLYDGIDECLCALVRGGMKLYIATSKPDFMAERVVEHFDIKKYFNGIFGAKPDMSISSKKDVISLLRNAHPEITPENSIMVGDREHDVFGARHHGIGCVGVLWGYGSEKELCDAGVVTTVKTPLSLSQYLLCPVR